MAVYTDVSDEEMEDFVALYAIGEVVSFKGIAEGVSNSNFLLQTDTGTYILTLYEERRTNPADLPFFLDLMEHLAARGLACPTPLHARDGAVIGQLCGKPAALVSFLQGLSPRRITPDHCAALGEAMARMHVAGADFPRTRPNDLSQDGWHALFKATKGRADKVAPGLADKIKSALAELKKTWPSDLPRGLIHADLFPDNVFFRGDKATGTERVSGIIDFYFACTDFLAYDVAICLNAWCFEADGAFNATKARQMLAGYRRVRDLSPAELAALPVLAQGAALRFLLTRLFDWLDTPPGAFVKRKDPLEYLRKLRFHQQVGGPGGYGIL